jgi:hypothetical protein
MEIVSCPECGVPAEIDPRGMFGGVAHVRVTCVRQHWFLMSRDMLDPPVAVEAAPFAARTT